VTDDQIITFPSGLVGCADWRRFVLLSDDEAPALHVLQSLDEPAISFLVTGPVLVEPDYRVAIGAPELTRLGLTRPDEAVVLCILTARGDPPRITANLMGPIVINPATRLAVQLVLADSPYGTQHPLVLAGDDSASASL
jgi:flagellar assembly factor FliW